MKKRISIYICVMMLAFSFAGCTSERKETGDRITADQIHWRICGIRMLLSQCRKIRYYEKGVVVEYGQAALDRVYRNRKSRR